MRHPLGADTAMGGVRAYSLTILDGLIKSIDRKDPYDHPHLDAKNRLIPGALRRDETIALAIDHQVEIFKHHDAE